MKKVALIFVLAVMLCPAFNRTASAESPLYTLSVSKYNGGILSLINLYGNVTYSETFDDMDNVIHANLTCYGQGYTRCRVPAESGSYASSVRTSALPSDLVDVVNSLLEQGERKVEQGVVRGSASKKVIPSQSTRTADNRHRDMYIYSSNWNCNSRGDGTVTVSLYKTNTSVLGM